MKLAIIFLAALIFSSCPSQKAEVEPVKPAGFDSLQQASESNLDAETLTKLIKSLREINSLNRRDAASLFEIYEKRTDEFDRANNSRGSDNYLGIEDVRKVFELMLRHEELRDKVARVAQQVALTIMLDGDKFEEAYFNMGATRGGWFVSSYLKAYRNAVSNDKEIFDAEYNRQLTNGEINILRGYEQVFYQVVAGKRAADENAKKQAREFLDDLKTCNQSLPANQKILDDGGRLPAYETVSQPQKEAILGLIHARFMTPEENAENVKQAANRVSERLRESIDRFELNLRSSTYFQ